MITPPTRPRLPDSLHMQSGYLSPASTVASDSSFSWNQMPPHQDNNGERSLSHVKRKSTSASPRDESPRDGGFVWVTGSTPAELKSKEHMTSVRKKAMSSYLETEKSKDTKSRANSEISDKSRSSIGSQGGAFRPRVVAAHNGKGARTTKQPSPAKSPASTMQTQKAPRTASQVARIQKQVESILPQAPIVVPMEDRTDFPFDLKPAPRLVSIGKALDPFQTMFQSSNPRVSVEELKYHCSKFFGTHGLGKYWIPTCLDYAHTFLSTLYLASAHSDVIKERSVESLETAALRQDIMHLIGADLLDPEKNVADPNIIAVSQIIIGEVIGRQEAALVYHEAGIESMIKLRGGLKKLGMEGRLASSVSWVNLASAILREDKPRLMYVDYCAAESKKSYPFTATLPESPVYCPHGKYVTIQRSSMCTQDALKLLDEMRIMIDLFLHETNQSRRNSHILMNLYRRITTEYAPISQLARTTVVKHKDWRYEAIRITAVIQATAIIRRLPLSDTLVHVAQPRKPSSVYTSSTASRSNDSLVSPFDGGYETPSTQYSTSPAYSMPSTNPAMPQTGSPFTTHRSSNASAYSFSSEQRPSISSVHSSSPSFGWLNSPRPVVSAPTGPNVLLKSLKEALENSNLSNCWGEMAGVILWIGLVVGAASRNSDDKPLKKYFSATTMRAGIMLCFEHPEAMYSTMLSMTEMVDRLRPEASVNIARRESGSEAKKSRTRA
ncbi:hypothetical protein EJ02DRAFT_398158 [Clathrospora elynae]|uniref:Uncharacterized protein n=1 Tax=Clathrospora elynae TaxID=706981 RepID=A0A6A5T5X0_9PLEO|nr:hypothetical protein EJ02DRAFT_398158 [Clathrospora elynae]